jgi:hypothetical protein
MRSKAIKAIKKHLMNKILLFFFPIRTLDFGIKGGLKLPNGIKDKWSNERNIKVHVYENYTKVIYKIPFNC